MLLIVFLLVFGYLLIATGHLTGVNKAAIAMFIGTIGWIFYVCWGEDFVMKLYANDYMEWLDGREATSQTVKFFIYDHIFLKHVGKAAAIVMFLVATMTIVEILGNNGCFDFIAQWIRTRNPNRLLWTITLATFLLSANLDNLTTATMMLVIMHGIVKNRKQRMLIGSAIVLAANAGGCFTVIGDPLGLVLWGNGAVTASYFSAYLFPPVMISWIIPTLLISKKLPTRLDVEWAVAPYRGNDTRLNSWQRIVMFFVGIGGLWFIPTFHNIWIVGALSGLLSSLVDTFTIAISDISLYPVLEQHQLSRWADADYMDNFVMNGAYWLVIAFSTAVGGCLLSVGSTSGIALMKMEHVRLGWYLKNISPKVLLGWVIGFGLLWLEFYMFE